jgi:molybdenum cofactor cytidylyltransferase
MGMRNEIEHRTAATNSNECVDDCVSGIELIVMAAGLSRRFGSNKLMADFRGKPLSGWIFEALRSAGCAPCTVTVVWHDPDIAVLAESYGFNTCFNPNPEEGQAASIRLGLAASKEAEAYMFLTADQPLLRGQTISGMLKSFPAGQGKIMMAVHKGNTGNPVIFDRKYKASLVQLKGDTGGKQIIRQYPEAVVGYEIEYAEELMDVDRAEDLAHLSKILNSDSDRR